MMTVTVLFLFVSLILLNIQYKCPTISQPPPKNNPVNYIEREIINRIDEVC